MPHRSRLSILVIFLVCAVGTVHAQDRSGTGESGWSPIWDWKKMTSRHG
jgi:hypothetical protein